MGYNNGYDDGEWFGKKEGYRKGYKDAKAKYGRPDDEVRKEAYAEGRSAGYAAGTDEATNGTVTTDSVEIITSLGGKTCDPGRYVSLGAYTITGVDLPVAEYVVSNAFSYNESLYNATFYENLKALGEFAFAGCTSMSTFSAPALETIGGNAFQDVPYATQFFADGENSDNLKTIDYYAFMMMSDPYGDAGSVDLRFPAVTYVGESAFQGRSSLLSVDLPVYIGHDNYELAEAFSGCPALRKVSLPKFNPPVDWWDISCTSLFAGCDSLEEIRFDSVDEDTVVAHAYDMCIPDGCKIWCKLKSTGQVGMFVYHVS